ncbi:MAG: hypothetical protein MZW92_12715 [Comamonadaceae bacterium]|nr:hypothetical protein [Comamonadaceae bacterium]
MTAALAACGITTNPTTNGTDRHYDHHHQCGNDAPPVRASPSFPSTTGTTARPPIWPSTASSTTSPASTEWTNGWHKGMHLAGTDATAAFGDSPHSLSFLNQLTIVGSLVG